MRDQMHNVPNLWAFEIRLLQDVVDAVLYTPAFAESIAEITEEDALEQLATLRTKLDVL
jgi:hypothetical protein